MQRNGNEKVILCMESTLRVELEAVAGDIL